ncbi:hypothetical protein [Methanobrevibacter sp.]|uniref:hypothetical protein n=1 Tax=Methanobrevibacter sp. TaxID=66852 RepID=UPI0026DF1075|nr:hypothetical protein [Methanobrevibacter sp.]MDO5823261.1 hypothetical protein [Methanobrevibacter sp.]
MYKKILALLLFVFFLVGTVSAISAEPINQDIENIADEFNYLNDNQDIDDLDDDISDVELGEDILLMETDNLNDTQDTDDSDNNENVSDDDLGNDTVLDDDMNETDDSTNSTDDDVIPISDDEIDDNKADEHADKDMNNNMGKTKLKETGIPAVILVLVMIVAAVVPLSHRKK